MILNNSQEQLKLTYLGLQKTWGKTFANFWEYLKHKGILMSMYMPAARYSCNFRLHVKVKNVLAGQCIYNGQKVLKF